MLDPEFFVEGQIRVTELWNPTRKSGHLHLTLSDMVVKIMEGDTQVGETVGCIGGATEIRIGEYTYTLNPLDLWKAVNAMHQNRMLKDGGQ